MSAAQSHAHERTEEGTFDRGFDNPGPAVRRERRRQGMAVRELARRVGVTASHISRVERGVTNPSIGTLWKISDQLGVQLCSLFSAADDREQAMAGDGRRDECRVGSPDESRAEVVVEPGARDCIETAGIQWQRLTPPGDRMLDFIECTYQVGAGESEAYCHRGREYVLVQKGSLLLNVGSSQYVLTPGYSAAFDSSTPHRFSNIGNEPAVAIWAVTSSER